MSRNKKQAPPLRDGVLQVCKVTNVAEPGDVPEDGLEPIYSLRYDERIVGMSRYWQAKQASATIGLLVRCHRLRDVTTHHVVILRDGEQYAIKQIQYPPEIEPKVMDLSLERLADKYAVKGVASHEH